MSTAPTKRSFNFWAWFAPGFLAIVAAANVVVIVLAVNTDDGLVREDWYEAGLVWGQEEAAATDATSATPAAATATPATTD
jgi:nitrogen fixation protein FixH